MISDQGDEVTFSKWFLSPRLAYPHQVAMWTSGPTEARLHNLDVSWGTLDVKTYPRWFQNVFRESLDLSCSHFLAWKLFSESILTIKQRNNRDNVPLVGTFLILGNLLQQFIQESNVKVNQHFFPLLAVKRIQSFLWLESSWIQKSEDLIIWTLSVSRFMPCHLWMRQGAFMYKMNLNEIYCLYGKPSKYIS